MGAITTAEVDINEVEDEVEAGDATCTVMATPWGGAARAARGSDCAAGRGGASSGPGVVRVRAPQSPDAPQTPCSSSVSVRPLSSAGRARAGAPRRAWRWRPPPRR